MSFPRSLLAAPACLRWGRLLPCAQRRTHPAPTFAPCAWEPPSASDPQQPPLSSPMAGDPSVHFLSVYFFSVYTRPTSVELGRHSLSSNFWRRQRHPFLRPSKKKNAEPGAAAWLSPFYSSPRPDFLLRSALPPLSRSVCLLRLHCSSPPQATGYPVTALAPCRTAASGCAVGFPWLAAGAPSALGKGSLMRTAILPGMHLNPSDFRS